MKTSRFLLSFRTSAIRLRTSCFLLALSPKEHKSVRSRIQQGLVVFRTDFSKGRAVSNYDFKHRQMRFWPYSFFIWT